jgi:hypothetical protein
VSNTILIRLKWPNFGVFGQLAFHPGKNYEEQLEFPPAVARLHQMSARTEARLRRFSGHFA